ncbi:hypothetical protein Lalb_Chr15g0084291 [Lupinus albus]|uniref:Uncharacterized protein n=1 Tax=Lupinus albus TaxID=3870 RepID=A0A6A4P9G3_LUPAL|nr:hypothetical protein Lalb_Chr15g0084291 [Lupinus albus]
MFRIRYHIHVFKLLVLLWFFCILIYQCLDIFPDAALDQYSILKKYHSVTLFVRCTGLFAETDF